MSHLQRGGERRDAVQAEAPRRARRPGNALRPGLLIRGVLPLLPAAHSGAAEDNNPQRQARHDSTAAGGQHLRPGQEWAVRREDAEGG